MVDDINDNVGVFGRIFHIRSEVSEGARPKIRTTVTLDGAVVASREEPVDHGDASEGGLRDRLAYQHALIISNLVKRTAEFEAAARKPLRPPAREHDVRPPDATALAEVTRPDPDADPVLLAAVKARQLIGPFSLALQPSPYHDEEAIRERLERAGEMIDDIMEAPESSGLRLDEQVRFFDLRERIAAWSDAGSDPEVGAKILLAVVIFAGHLRRISDRQELVEFDHRLLTWAIWAIGSDAASDELLDHLRVLYGRDAELDRLLDQAEPVVPDRLLQVLLGLLDRTTPRNHADR